MRIIFDFIKNVLRKVDGYWIESAGHPVTIKGYCKRDKTVEKLYLEGTVFVAIPPVLIYAFYDYPKQQQLNTFGIDEPDEIGIQVNAKVAYSKLGLIPPIGTLLLVEDSDWLVVNRNYIYNRFIGKYRLNLTCRRYQESVTAGKNSIYMQSKEQ
jgi:hypothetical protein